MTNNYVLLNGKLSRDIEVSKNDKGNSFVKFCLICTRDGNSSYSDYVNCIAFGEIANAICRKGEKEKRIQLITLKEISEQTHMRKMVKRIILQMWL